MTADGVFTICSLSRVSLSARAFDDAPTIYAPIV